MDEDVAADLRSAVTGGGRWPLFLGFRTTEGVTIWLRRSIVQAVEALPNPDTCVLHLDLRTYRTIIVTERPDEVVLLLDPEPRASESQHHAEPGL